MGIRGSRRYHDGLLLGRRDRHGECQLQWMRQPVGQPRDLTGRIVQAKCIRPLRHGRQRDAMGARLLSWRLHGSADRWFGLDERRLQSACRPRRVLGHQSAGPPLGQPPRELHRVPKQHSWLPGWKDAYTLSLNYLSLTAVSTTRKPLAARIDTANWGEADSNAAPR